MFLGSCPNSDNIINHWLLLNKDDIINDNIYIVIHPLLLNNFIINDNFKKLFNNNNIYIVDSDHHLETSWRSHTLTCTTLLMMQYAHIKYKNFFNKYILLSAVCCPLYSLNQLYNILTQEEFNNKSWFLFININNLYIDNIIDKLYNKIGIKTSQWMVIDNKHIYYFYYNDPTCRTYIKNDYYNIIINPEIILSTSDKQFNIYLNSYNYINYINIDKYTAIDAGTDETYFINWILFILFNNNNINNINKYANINNLIEDNFIIFNYEKIIERAKFININFINKLIEQDILNNNKIFYILPFTKINNHININNQIKIDLLKKYKFNNQSNKNYITQVTYIDNFGITYAINPFTMIRTIDNIINLKLNTLLFLNFSSNSLNILNDNINNLDLINKKNLFISINNHPIEFSTFTLLNIINVYILYLIIFNNKILENIYILEIFKIIKKIFNINDIQINLKIQFDIIVEKINSDNSLLDNKFGTFITADYIISAILYNCLFIRKCLDTSLINNYSNIIKDYDKFKISNNLINNFEINNYTIIDNNNNNNNTINQNIITHYIKKNITFFQQYKKCGNKYIRF